MSLHDTSTGLFEDSSTSLPFLEVSRVLNVVVRNALFDITPSVLNQILEPYGNIESIDIGAKWVEMGFPMQNAVIKMKTKATAASVKAKLNKKNIYDNCCTLQIEYGKDCSETTKASSDFSIPLLAEASPSSPSKQTKKSRKRQADNATFASSKQARTEEPNPRQDHVQDNQLVGPQETWNEEEVGLIRAEYSNSSAMPAEAEEWKFQTQAEFKMWSLSKPGADVSAAGFEQVEYPCKAFPMPQSQFWYRTSHFELASPPGLWHAEESKLGYQIPPKKLKWSKSYLGPTLNNQIPRPKSFSFLEASLPQHFHGNVILVYNFPPFMDPAKVVNLFCVYGDVIRVKFLIQIPGSALVEMSDSDGAWRVINNLNMLTIMGNEINIKMSNQKAVFANSAVISRRLDNGAPVFWDYSKSGLQRFSTPADANKNRIVTPSKAKDIDNWEKLSFVFTQNEAPVPVACEFIPSTAQRPCNSGHLEFDSVSESVEALLKLNNVMICKPGTTAGLLFKLCFSIVNQIGDP